MGVGKHKWTGQKIPPKASRDGSFIIYSGNENKGEGGGGVSLWSSKRNLLRTSQLLKLKPNQRQNDDRKRMEKLLSYKYTY